MKKKQFKRFTIKDFTKSNVAKEFKIDNSIPNPRIGKNLIYTINFAERVQKKLGVPITITSGYRSLKLNRIIKGAKNSRHVRGLAFDFVCKYSPEEVCNRLKDEEDILYDQLILESSWVHISCKMKGKLRRKFIG